MKRDFQKKNCKSRKGNIRISGFGNGSCGPVRSSAKRKELKTPQQFKENMKQIPARKGSSWNTFEQAFLLK
jgi:hypothetical protein